MSKKWSNFFRVKKPGPAFWKISLPKTSKFLEVGSCEFRLVCTSDNTDALKSKNSILTTLNLRKVHAHSKMAQRLITTNFRRFSVRSSWPWVPQSVRKFPGRLRRHRPWWFGVQKPGKSSLNFRHSKAHTWDSLHTEHLVTWSLNFFSGRNSDRLLKSTKSNVLT